MNYFLFIRLMKSDNTLLLGVGVLAAIVLLNSSSGGQVVTSPFDFSKLDNEPDDLDRINRLYAVLAAQGLTNLQNQLLLAQMFYETGILNTSGTNYTAIDDYNNWGGIGGSGSLHQYPDLQSFFNEYLQYLRKGANPLGASDTYDFVVKLNQNGYFGAHRTPAQVQTYLSGINNIFHQLYLSSQ